MTPLYIEIALWYFCRADEFPRLGAPAVEDAIKDLLQRGLLLRLTDEASAIHDYQCRYVRNEEPLRLYVEALCAVRLPVQRWVMP